MRAVSARRARSDAAAPLDVQLAALRKVFGQIPAGQRASFLARLDEVARAWTGQLTAEASRETTCEARS